MKRVAVFGMGYVGCVSAACLSRDGHRVFGVDTDPVKVDSINHGITPVLEPGLGELLHEEVARGNLSATSDATESIRNSDLAIIAVGTPSADDGSVETHALERVVQSIGAALRGLDRPYTVVVRSTVLPGILEQRLAPLLEEA